MEAATRETNVSREKRESGWPWQLLNWNDPSPEKGTIGIGVVGRSCWWQWPDERRRWRSGWRLVRDDDNAKKMKMNSVSSSGRKR